VTSMLSRRLRAMCRCLISCRSRCTVTHSTVLRRPRVSARRTAHSLAAAGGVGGVHPKSQGQHLTSAPSMANRRAASRGSGPATARLAPTARVAASVCARRAP
jgi:hypothetical protein